jgi:hypothetical protein
MSVVISLLLMLRTAVRNRVALPLDAVPTKNCIRQPLVILRLAYRQHMRMATRVESLFSSHWAHPAADGNGNSRPSRASANPRAFRSSGRSARQLRYAAVVAMVEAADLWSSHDLATS